MEPPHIYETRLRGIKTVFHTITNVIYVRSGVSATADTPAEAWIPEFQRPPTRAAVALQAMRSPDVSAPERLITALLLSIYVCT